MKKKTFLTLALAGLAALGYYSVKQINLDEKIVHSQQICPIASTLYDLGLKDWAYQHQARAINKTENYSAEYVKEDRSMKFVGYLENPGNTPDNLNVYKDGLYLHYNGYGDQGKLAIAYEDAFIELKYDDLLIKELRIR